jgi:hypothetical protein
VNILEVSARLSRLNISGAFPQCINSDESFLLRAPASPHIITCRVLTMDFPNSLELHRIKRLKPVNAAECLFSGPDQVQCQIDPLGFNKVGVNKKGPTLRQIISLLKLNFDVVVTMVNHQWQNSIKGALSDGNPAFNRAR